MIENEQQDDMLRDDCPEETAAEQAAAASWDSAQEETQAAQETADQETSSTKKRKKLFGRKEDDLQASYNALLEEFEKAKAEIEELKDSRMRLMAEYDNFKRRSQKEKERLYGDSVVDVTAQWLPVLDNLERAAQAADQLDTESDKDQIKNVADGIDLIRKQADQAMTKLGVKEIAALDMEFDPNLHEAVMRIDSDEHDIETVVEVFAKGYMYEDRVIRHSVVKVAN